MAGVRVIIRDGLGRICLVHHGYGSRDWNVPGGAVEQSESILEAGLREVVEETGLVIRLSGFVGLYSIPDTSDLIAVLLERVAGSLTVPADLRVCPSRGLPNCAGTSYGTYAIHHWVNQCATRYR